MSRIRLVAMFVAAAFSVWTVGSAVAQAPAPAAKPAETKPADPAKPAMETKPTDKPTASLKDLFAEQPADPLDDGDDDFDVPSFLK